MGRVASPPDRPTLIYDGDCGFCRYWVGRWRGATRDRVDYLTSQVAAGRFPEIPPGDLQASVHLVSPEGSVSSGALAVFQALATVKGRGIPLLIYRSVPGAAALCESFYRFVADRRVLFSALTRWLWGPDPGPHGFRTSSRIFLAALGLVHLVAFISLGLQVRGLAGERGILPAAPWLERLGERMGWERLYHVPTLAWVDAGDTALWLMCLAGALASVLLAAGIAPLLSAGSCWILYLSLSRAVRLFLGFQWDTLLLEAGLLGAFLFPSGWRLRSWRARSPSPVVLFLLRWLLFRLMLGSGIAKLGGGDPVWRDLTALAYHYETQPLPTWTAWFMHQLPGWIHGLSALIMFGAELAAPLLIFAPRRLRHAGFLGLAGLQTVLLATGNFAFFNWLSLALCLVLLDETAWPRFLRGTLPEEEGALAPRRPVLRALGRVLAAAVVVVSGSIQAQRAFLVEAVPAPVRKAGEWLAPFRSLNTYGLFVNMTTERPEITIEGTLDGRDWREIPFRWKPGDPSRRPAFVAPHQPRLDWQMWFAALGSCRRNPWVIALMQRIMEGSPEVLALLGPDPFRGRPPTALRAVLWDYRFTTPEERRATGDWWIRARKGLYCPVVSLRAPPGR